MQKLSILIIIGLLIVLCYSKGNQITKEMLLLEYEIRKEEMLDRKREALKTNNFTEEEYYKDAAWAPDFGKVTDRELTGKTISDNNAEFVYVYSIENIKFDDIAPLDDYFKKNGFKADIHDAEYSEYGNYYIDYNKGNYVYSILVDKENSVIKITVKG